MLTGRLTRKPTSERGHSLHLSSITCSVCDICHHHSLNSLSICILPSLLPVMPQHRAGCVEKTPQREKLYILCLALSCLSVATENRHPGRLLQHRSLSECGKLFFILSPHFQPLRLHETDENKTKLEEVDDIDKGGWAEIQSRQISRGPMNHHCSHSRLSSLRLCSKPQNRV